MTIHEEFLKYPTGKIGKGKFCDQCKRFNARYVTCDTIAVKGKQVLLILRKRDPDKGHWAIPGGYLNWDETAEDCAKRELNEETGLLARQVTLLKVYSRPCRDRDGRQNVTLCYVTTDLNNKEKADKEEVSEMKWFPIDKLPEKIAFDHREMIKDYRKLHRM